MPAAICILVINATSLLYLFTHPHHQRQRRSKSSDLILALSVAYLGFLLLTYALVVNSILAAAWFAPVLMDLNKTSRLAELTLRGRQGMGASLKQLAPDLTLDGLIKLFMLIPCLYFLLEDTVLLLSFAGCGAVSIALNAVAFLTVYPVGLSWLRDYAQYKKWVWEDEEEEDSRMALPVSPGSTRHRVWGLAWLFALNYLIVGPAVVTELAGLIDSDQLPNLFLVLKWSEKLLSVIVVLYQLTWLFDGKAENVEAVEEEEGQEEEDEEEEEKKEIDRASDTTDTTDTGIYLNASQSAKLYSHQRPESEASWPGIDEKGTQTLVGDFPGGIGVSGVGVVVGGEGGMCGSEMVEERESRSLEECIEISKKPEGAMELTDDELVKLLQGC
jgi:hypothetical protein